MPPRAKSHHVRSFRMDGRYSSSACPPETLRLLCAAQALLTSAFYSSLATPGATGHSARFLPAPAVAITLALTCAAGVTV